MMTEASALSLLYRGTLASCNYACSYCPFAKKRDSRAVLARDASEVARFVAWCGAQQRRLRIFFTPWGEALVRRHYRQALQNLCAMPHVLQAGAQSNLAAPLAWLERMPPAQRARLALWCTFHPEQVSAERFLARSARLQDLGVAHAVGMVALRENIEQIEAMRAALPQHIYLWLNAYDRRGPAYYSAAMLARLQAIDPWFDYSHKPRPALGAACRAGSESLMLDGAGNLQRCHFIETGLGNLYQDDLQALLQESPCTRRRCDCYIGYAQRRDLPFVEDFGPGALMRQGPGSAG
ncbi:STM4011 family radical SAM protein [Massilia sp. W12]|uniref:STM4011 family radical SAM protein n=1 Tax=Massilia sp. W12 TaxID=3126507 RepID=UPI0030D20D30